MGVKSILAAVALWAMSGAALAEGAINWQPWTPDLFARSKAENRLVILDLQAVWCHWCHVMEETTYRDPAVVKLLADKFIAVQVDQDANPDLSNRYGDWGWPATILYAPDGTEIAKLRGYRNPEQMQAILAAFVKDPTPGPSIDPEQAIAPSTSIFLSEAQRKMLRDNWQAAYDHANGGWGDVLKFIDGGSMDYALALAEAGDAEAAAMARQTLDQSLKLIDPVWGGIYQYSDKPDWSSPHFEKIMQLQTRVLRHYSYAAQLFGEPRYRKAADDIARYLLGKFRSPEGAFYTSQDADVSEAVHGKDFYTLDAAAREKTTEPRIDTNIYARENGWAIGALAAKSGDAASLSAASAAARWIMTHRALPGGGFSHGEADRAGPYLGDTLAMGQAALDLYAATGDREWLKAANDAAGFITANFKADAGFATTKAAETASGPLSKPSLQIEENIDTARFFNLLARYTGNAAYREAAGHAMKTLGSDQVTSSRRFLSGILSADAEIAIDPVHITIVGGKADAKAQMLHDFARAYPAFYKRLDWWDPAEGPLVNPDVQYPDMGEAAAFACSNQICSRPAFTTEELAKTVKTMSALRTSANQ